MKLPAKAAYDLINSSDDFKEADVYMYDVPEDFRKTESLPLIRISEIADYNEVYSSNIPRYIVFNIQVDVWASDLQTLENYYIKLNNLFIAAGWARYMGNTDKDPDFNSTPRLYMRFKGSQKIEIN